MQFAFSPDTAASGTVGRQGLWCLLGDSQAGTFRVRGCQCSKPLAFQAQRQLLQYEKMRLEVAPNRKRLSNLVDRPDWVSGRISLGEEGLGRGRGHSRQSGLHLRWISVGSR